MFQRLVGFAPDLPPDTPGIVIDGYGFVPTMKGMEAAPKKVSAGVDTVTATAVGAASLIKIDGTIRTFVGTGTQLLEASGSTWTDRSAGTYSSTRWRFAQFGDTSLAAGGTGIPLQASASGAFATATGAPKCSLVETLRTQVMVFDTNEATFGAQPDRWWACAQNDVGDWTPALATLCVTGRLVSTPGAIIGAKRLNDDVAVYKEGSLYLGRFVEAPIVWKFDVVNDHVGAVNHESILRITEAGLPDVHFFMGRDNFYAFDGLRPVAIGTPIKDFFFQDEFNYKYRDNVRAVWDRDKGRVVWFYPSNDSASGALDRYIAYHPRSQRWGTPVNLSVRWAFAYTPASGPTYNTLGDSFSTYADIPALPYDSPYWISNVTRLGVIDGSGVLGSLTGTGDSATMTLFDIGMDGAMTFLRRLRPRFIADPAAGTLYPAWRDTFGGSLTSGSPSVALRSGRFDLLREARWHRERIEFAESVEITGLDIEAERGGDE